MSFLFGCFIGLAAAHTVAMLQEWFAIRRAEKELEKRFAMLDRIRNNVEKE